MSGRERILAALEKKPVDRLPFTPLIDAYALLGMPPGLTGDTTLSITHPRRQIATLRELGCDILLRHIATTEGIRDGARHLQQCGTFVRPVETTSELKGNEIRETLKTPAGTLTGIWKLMGSAGTIPHFTKYVVGNYEELKILDSALDYLDTKPPSPRHDIFTRYENLLGDEGLATASITPSPFMYLIMFVMGLQNTYVLLNEHRSEMERILAKLGAAQRRAVEAIAASAARVVIIYENTSSTLLSPAYFRRYCLPVLNDYAGILRAAGKIFLIHMCGKLNGMAADFVDAKFDGICDIAPTGDLHLYEAAGRLPGRVVVGGIDATTFASPDPETVKIEVTGIIERVKPYRGVLLGSGDAVPKDARVENIRLVKRLADTIGKYD